MVFMSESVQHSSKSLTYSDTPIIASEVIIYVGVDELH